MGDFIEENPGEFICLVCFHPDNEMHQCENGHQICSLCIPHLENCPQCQVPFGPRLTRPRQLRSYKHCSFLRRAPKSVPNHHEIFSFLQIPLCKWMGFKCDFNASKVTALIEHLESCHGAHKWRGTVWRNFSPDATFRSIYLQECDPDPLTSEKCSVLLLYTLTAEPNKPNFVSCVPIHLHDGHCNVEHQVHLQLFNQETNRVVSTWTGFPSYYKSAEEDFLHPIFRLSTNSIDKQPINSLTTFDLLLNFRVDKKLACNQPVDELEERMTQYSKKSGQTWDVSTPTNVFIDTLRPIIKGTQQSSRTFPTSSTQTAVSTEVPRIDTNFVANPCSALGKALSQLGVTQQSISSNVTAPVFGKTCSKNTGHSWTTPNTPLCGLPRISRVASNTKQSFRTFPTFPTQNEVANEVPRIDTDLYAQMRAASGKASRQLGVTQQSVRSNVTAPVFGQTYSKNTGHSWTTPKTLPGLPRISFTRSESEQSSSTFSDPPGIFVPRKKQIMTKDTFFDQNKIFGPSLPPIVPKRSNANRSSSFGLSSTQVVTQHMSSSSFNSEYSMADGFPGLPQQSCKKCCGFWKWLSHFKR